MSTLELQQTAPDVQSGMRKVITITCQHSIPKPMITQLLTVFVLACTIKFSRRIIPVGLSYWQNWCVAISVLLFGVVLLLLSLQQLYIVLRGL